MDGWMDGWMYGCMDVCNVILRANPPLWPTHNFWRVSSTLKSDIGGMLKGILNMFQQSF